MLYAEGNKSLAACCRAVGLNPESHGLRDRVKHGDIGKVVVHRMGELGITLDAPLVKIREMYDAKKEVLNPAISSNAAHLAAMVNGATVSPTIELGDNESQRWAVEQTLKLLGAYPKPNEDTAAKPDGPLAIRIYIQPSPHEATVPPTPQRAIMSGLTLAVKPHSGNDQNGDGGSE
jgi:hypothetical protein